MLGIVTVGVASLPSTFGTSWYTAQLKMALRMCGLRLFAAAAEPPVIDQSTGVAQLQTIGCLSAFVQRVSVKEC